MSLPLQADAFPGKEYFPEIWPPREYYPEDYRKKPKKKRKKARTIH